MAVNPLPPIEDPGIPWQPANPPGGADNPVASPNQPQPGATPPQGSLDLYNWFYQPGENGQTPDETYGQEGFNETFPGLHTGVYGWDWVDDIDWTGGTNPPEEAAPPGEEPTPENPLEPPAGFDMPPDRPGGGVAPGGAVTFTPGGDTASGSMTGGLTVPDHGYLTDPFVGGGGGGGGGGNPKAGQVPEGGAPSFIPESNLEGIPTAPTILAVLPEETVRGQMESLLEAGSPLLEMAREAGIRMAAERGLQNSNMAAEFGEMAFLQQALQIAQQDALTYSRRSELTMSILNQYTLAEQNFRHNALLSDQNYKQATVLQAMQNETVLEAAMISAGATVAAAGIHASASVQSAQIGATAMLERVGLEYQNTLGIMALDQQNVLARMAEQGDIDAMRDAELYGRDLNLSYMQQYGNANMAFINQLGFIGAQPGLSPSQQANAMDQITRAYEDYVNSLGTFYSSSPYWKPGGG